MVENALITTETRIVRRTPEIVERWHKTLDQDVSAGQIAASTAETYRAGMRAFCQWGASSIQTADDNVIKAWLAALRSDSRVKSQNTISIWFAGVRAFFQWAVAEGLCPADPTQGIKRGRRAGTNKRHLRKPLTTEEIARVLKAPRSARDTALLYLMAYTGVRTVEAYRADIEDLNTINGQLVLEVSGKGQDKEKEIVVIADKTTSAAIYTYLAERQAKTGPLFVSESDRSRGQRLTTRAIRAIIKKAFGDAGIFDARKTAHSLRHTAATTALDNGASVREVQAMLRHASPETTQIYLHESGRIENAAEKRIKYGIEDE